MAYASARWALRGFSSALRVDMRGTGVMITDVYLSKIASSYWDNNPGADERIPWVDHVIPTLSVEHAATIVTGAVERDRREATGPLMYTLFHRVGRPFPRLMQRLVSAGGAKRPASL